MPTRVSTTPEPPPPAKPPLKERLEQLVQRYGGLALGTYLAISGLIILGFAIAIRAGVGGIEGADTAVGFLGILGVAWVAAKVTIPLRIVATLALTPLLGRIADRLRARS
jgi:Protein of unknown function (DUF1279)